MALTPSQLALVACCAFFIHSSQASGVRDIFYNKIRNILSSRSFNKHQTDLPPTPKQVPNWGTNLQGILGQVSGVSVNTHNQPVIIHRGPRKWEPNSFNETFHFTQMKEGPIKVDTVLTLDPDTGEIMHQWGKNMFFMPHGITMDHHDNTWITDVAMHQVFKYPRGRKDPTLRLGELFTPGHNENNRLCMPTSVAVSKTGQIFVADGYCNQRILKYSHEGELERVFPHREEFLSLFIPHSISLLERHDLLCVADRENMRVVCFRAELQAVPLGAQTPFTIHQPDLGRVFAIASDGNLVYAVNGPTSSHIPLQGFTIDPLAEKIIDHWSPRLGTFQAPHAVAISPTSKELYVTEIGPNRVWKFTINAHKERPVSFFADQ